MENKKCIKCGRKAMETLTTKVNGRIIKVENFCAKHWVENEGESCLEHDLEVAQKFNDYKSVKPEIALEIGIQFPELAKKHGKILRKIVRNND